MTDYKNMGIKDLPGSGAKFRMTGAGSFPNKLRRAAHGELNILDSKNQKAIVDEVKKHETEIRRGRFSGPRQREALLKIRASDKTVTELDRRKIKEVLKHLGPGAATEEIKIPKGYKLIKTADGKSHLIEKGVKPIKSSGGEGFLTKKQINRNLFYRAREDSADDPGNRSGRTTYTKQYAGGKKVESYGVYGGDKEDLGVKTGKIGFASAGVYSARNVSTNKGKVGFAADYKTSKSPDNSASKTPLGGTKPLGL